MLAVGLAVAVGGVVTMLAHRRILASKARAKEMEANKDIVVLHGFPRRKNRSYPNLSPFVVKVEMLLKMARVPYKFKPSFGVGGGPTSRFPFIEFNGVRIGDSSLIAEWIASKYTDIDAGLTRQQLAISRAFQRYIEEYFYFIALYFRWHGEYAVSNAEEMFGQYIPAIPRYFVRRSVQKSMELKLIKQGVGSHKLEDIIKFGKQCIDDIECFLGDKQYFLGVDRPTMIDVVLFSFAVTCDYPGGDSTMTSYMISKRNINDHCERMRTQFFETQQ